MRFDIVSLFPDFVSAVTQFGVTGRALDQGLLELNYWNPRDFTHDRHRTVDDRPYGGGPGMVMKYEPLRDCVQAIKRQTGAAHKVICLSPQGRMLKQADLRELAARPGVILVAGRYEGIDERFMDAEVDEEWSIGDYVLSGGELPAMILVDGISRLLPGVLGDEDSAQQDSFMNGLLDCPHYTRPEVSDNRAVPEVLLAGDHQQIARWRRQQALGRTWQRRRDLIDAMDLQAEDQQLLREYLEQQSNNDKV